MQTLPQYQELYRTWSQQGILPQVSPETYALCHYFPNWYPLLKAHTPETVRLELLPGQKPDADFAAELQTTLEALEAEGWSGFFLKDDVKSLKTGLGSRLNTSTQAKDWLKAFCQIRELEGGVCVRRLEEWQVNTETRWFVWQEEAYGPHGEQGNAHSADLPAPVQAALQAIDSPFYSVDVVQNAQGQWRLVELGDGQVSDTVGWTVERFGEIFV